MYKKDFVIVSENFVLFSEENKMINISLTYCGRNFRCQFHATFIFNVSKEENIYSSNGTVTSEVKFKFS